MIEIPDLSTESCICGNIGDEDVAFGGRRWGGICEEALCSRSNKCGHSKICSGTGVGDPPGDITGRTIWNDSGGFCHPPWKDKGEHTTISNVRNPHYRNSTSHALIVKGSEVVPDTVAVILFTRIDRGVAALGRGFQPHRRD